MTLRVSSNALDYVRSRGGLATIRSSPRHGCCGGTAHVVIAELGGPDDLARFSEHSFGGVRVFVEDGIGGPWHLGLDELLGIRSLFVEPLTEDSAFPKPTVKQQLSR